MIPVVVGGALVVVAVLLLALIPSSSKPAAARQTTSPTPTRTHRASPTASATPSTGNLQLAQLQVGDCLTGANLELDQNTPWPRLSLAVPCNQGHTAEVFYANNTFWGKNGGYPGYNAIKNAATTACDNAFKSYVGIEGSKSIYTWTDIVPDQSAWPDGDRGLHCVVYYATSAKPAGVLLYHSVKGAAK